METWACEACGGVNPDGMRFCGHCGAPAVTTPPQVHAPPAEANVADALRSFVTEQVAERLIEAGGRIPEERRLITALFADVSGFTTAESFNASSDQTPSEFHRGARPNADAPR